MLRQTGLEGLFVKTVKTGRACKSECRTVLEKMAPVILTFRSSSEVLLPPKPQESVKL